MPKHFYFYFLRKMTMSQNKIYVGSLSYDVTANELQTFFSQYGEIEEAKLIMDRETGRSKGFAFITYGTQDAAQEAVSKANGIDLQGRKIRVNIARENTGDRRRDGGSSGRSGRGGARGGRF
ncbi:RNA-binding protein [Coxiella endosymbiont of Ornithodoros amblus]|uniref:RNA recognition motif domain-containing protein n=1 Tax=Coxiella endosymbiont of Ornithodoros amblus TaxID=1656166 RepID=UPI00244DD0B9|nr:RNA-binding protein [Coxiella endosymbiont of Ornithodoros amblus]MBW5802848.1 RNA-binding protein [Coxiella endosymbiont of Ornithodoros amblus]